MASGLSGNYRGLVDSIKSGMRVKTQAFSKQAILALKKIFGWKPSLVNPGGSNRQKVSQNNYYKQLNYAEALPK